MQNFDQNKLDPSSKIILGIDPGTRVTGYGIIVLKNSLVEPIDFGCIRPPVSCELSKRYLFLFNGIERLLEKYAPTEVAVETQFVHKNAQSAIKLAMARAMLLLAASKRDIPIFEYTPKKAKLAIVGNGSASKEQIQKMIQLLLKLPSLPEPEDAADALALAICHLHTIHYRQRLNLCSNTSKGR